MSRIKVNIKIRSVDYVFRGVPFHVYADGKVHRLDDNTWPSNNRPNGEGYIYFSVKDKKYKLHRLVYSALVEDVMDFPKIEVDHWNLNKLDNCITNLRRATSAQNKYNRGLQSNNASGVPHIHTAFRGKMWGWLIEIICDGQRPFKKWRTMGPLPIPDPLPPVPQDLIDIRNTECRRMFGEFARLV